MTRSRRRTTTSIGRSLVTSAGADRTHQHRRNVGARVASTVAPLEA